MHLSSSSECKAPALCLKWEGIPFLLACSHHVHAGFVWWLPDCTVSYSLVKWQNTTRFFKWIFLFFAGLWSWTGVVANRWAPGLVQEQRGQASRREEAMRSWEAGAAVWNTDLEHDARIPLAAALSYWWDSAGGCAGRFQCRIISLSQVQPRELCSPTSETDFIGNKNRANVCSVEIFKHSMPITREYGNKIHSIFWCS